MNFEHYVVDAFASRPFAGNPAAVCLLAAYPEDALLQAIATENNLSETAFVVPLDGAATVAQRWQLRWFTPAMEIDLCGHATLASARVIFDELRNPAQCLQFQTRSGELRARRSDVKTSARVSLDFPAEPPQSCAPPAALLAAFGKAKPLAVLRSRYLLVLLANAAAVRDLAPDFVQLKRLDTGVIVTANGEGEGCDFVSRFFGPIYGINEDPVTGSAHCALTPFWAQRLGKSALFAKQVSARGGELYCEMQQERVLIGGDAVIVNHSIWRLPLNSLD